MATVKQTNAPIKLEKIAANAPLIKIKTPHSFRIINFIQHPFHNSTYTVEKNKWFHFNKLIIYYIF